jgi:hypothetical protein|tara:strand:- start:2140 stop:2772 length:633 start_codon:yes stop_codon:yes gene_type:complete
MAEVSGLQGVLTDLFGQYMSGGMPYEEYASNVQMIQRQDPIMFQEVQDYNTTQKGKMLDTLQFDTDNYSMDNWSTAGLDNIKSGNLDVPFGVEGKDSFLPISKGVMGASGDGRVFISGKAIEGAEKPLAEVLRHEGSHSVFDFPSISRGQEEALARQRDSQYAQINNRPASAPPISDLQADQLRFIDSNINKPKEKSQPGAWETFSGLFK